ncbi:uncharacterized protein H6S33_007668 [Morchella sextelata]|uniref:uncharacterized protein n=1 Tax=Morchella sextelata TaxID=1174677 RepID=UPI001D058E74|nr:uncharacterized protein H6S33_007668 [Morchella sextelata]KAH0603346.1 hypothetical protein H6S33_007668 [Morchella sextelata]
MNERTAAQLAREVAEITKEISPMTKPKGTRKYLLAAKIKTLICHFKRTCSTVNATGFHHLPADIIINILFEIDDVEDLHSFVLTSPFINGLFLRHKPTLLTRHARAILTDAWDEGTEVLTWQRHTTANFTATHDVLRDLRSPFVLQDHDLRQLIINRAWFENCRAIYLITLERSGDETLPTFRESRVVQYFFGRTRTELFPHRLFYITWLLQLRFQNERLEAFASRPQPDAREVADCFLMGRIMFCASPGLAGFVNMPTARESWGQMLRRNLITTWVVPPPTPTPGVAGGFTMHVDSQLFVKQKVMWHLVARVAREVGTFGEAQRDGLSEILEDFTNDFGVLGLEALMLKYRIPSSVWML